MANGRLYVTDDLIREDRQAEGREEIRITDLFRGTTTIFDPQLRQFQLQRETISLPRNPLQFCTETPLIYCSFEQQEVMLGRETERWGAEVGLGEWGLRLTAWYDPQIQYPLRLQLAESGSLELKNIQVARLPSSLFTLPFDAERVEKVQGVALAPFALWP